jgi:ATP-dependent RNA helicase DeaD
VSDEASSLAPPPPTFDVIPLSADVRKAIDALGYVHPTPVQRAVFEPASRGRSLVVQARTGTGKTAAFGLPIVDQLVRRGVDHVQALILTPTRELALQVARELTHLAQFRGTKVSAIYGGAPMGKQIEELADGAQVVVGTPGRVLDHLRRGTLDPSNIRIFVLDEADEMLSMGFAKELHAIVETLPRERQGLFFSATIPPDIERLAINHLRDPEFVTLSSDQVGALSIQHFVYLTGQADPRKELLRVLEVENPESAIIFCNTKDQTERVAEALQGRGFEAEWLNGDLEQRERERIMARTREGKLRFLVATDVAARGIDISHLTHVINADFPESAEQYVHRTGRTGRAGKTGTAISLVGPKNIGALYILRLTYKIRPIEKQLPSAADIKTRGEHDLVTMFADAFGGPTHPDDLALARRLLTHENYEQIVAGLLRAHLGAREASGTDPRQEATEARRAKNPPVVEPPRAAEPTAPPRGRRGREERPAPAMDARAAPDARPGMDARPKREGGGRDRPRRGRGGMPHASFASWEPKSDPDDDQPILDAGAAPPAERVGTLEFDTRSPALPDVVREPRSLDGRSPALPEPGRSLEDDPTQLGLPAGFTVSTPASAPRLPDDLDNAPTPALELEDDPRDFARIFVNVGRRDGASVAAFQRLLTDEGGLAKKDTGRILVRDRISFVNVRRELLERAIAVLSGQIIGGRTLAAEPARDQN